MGKEVNTKRLQDQVENEVIPRFVSRVKDTIGGDFTISVAIDYDTFNNAEDIIGAYKKIAGQTCLGRIASTIEELVDNRVAKKAVHGTLSKLRVTFHDDNSGVCSVENENNLLNYAIQKDDDKLIEQEELLLLIEELCRIDQEKSFHEIASNLVPMYISAINENFLKRIRIEVEFKSFAEIKDTTKRTELIRAVNEDSGRYVFWEMYKALKYLFNREIVVFDKVHCFLNIIRVVATESDEERSVHFSKKAHTLEITISFRKGEKLLDKNDVVQSLAKRLDFDYKATELVADEEEERLMLVKWFEEYTGKDSIEKEGLKFLRAGLNVQVFKVKGKKLKGEKYWLTVDENVRSLLFKSSPSSQKAKDSLPLESMAELFKGPTPNFLSDKAVKMREDRTLRLVITPSGVMELVTAPKEREQFDNLFSSLRMLLIKQKSIRDKADKLFELYTERFRSMMGLERDDAIKIVLDENSLLDSENYLLSKEYASARVMPIVSNAFITHLFNDEVGIERAKEFIKKIIIGYKSERLGYESTRFIDENTLLFVFHIQEEVILKFTSDIEIYNVLNAKLHLHARRLAADIEENDLNDTLDKVLERMEAEEDDDFDDFVDIDYESVWQVPMTAEQYSFAYEAVKTLLKKELKIVEKICVDEIGKNSLKNKLEGIVVLYKPPSQIPVAPSKEEDKEDFVMKAYFKEMKDFIDQKLKEEETLYDVFWLDPSDPTHKFFHLDVPYLVHFLNDRLNIDLQRTLHNKLNRTNLKKYSDDLFEFSGDKMRIDISVDDESFGKSPNPVYSLGQVSEVVIPEVISSIKKLHGEDQFASAQLNKHFKGLTICHGKPIGSYLKEETGHVHYNVDTIGKQSSLNLVMFGEKNNLTLFTKIFRVSEVRNIDKIDKDKLPTIRKTLSEIVGADIQVEIDWPSMRNSLNELRSIEIGSTDVVDIVTRVISDLVKEEPYDLAVRHFLRKLIIKHACPDKDGKIEKTRMSPTDGVFVVVFHVSDGLLVPFVKNSLRNVIESGCEISAVVERASLESKVMKNFFLRMKKCSGKALDIQIDWDSFLHIANKEFVYKQIPTVLDKIERSLNEACREVVTKQEVEAQLQGIIIQYEGKGTKKLLSTVKDGYELREKRNLGRKLSKKEKSEINYGHLYKTASGRVQTLGGDESPPDDSKDEESAVEVFREAGTCFIRGGYLFDIFKIKGDEQTLEIKQTNFEDIMNTLSKHYALEEKRAYYQIDSGSIPRFMELLHETIGSEVEVTVNWLTFDVIDKRIKSEAYQKIEGEYVFGAVKKAIDKMLDEPHGKEALPLLKRIEIKHCDEVHREVGVYFSEETMIYVIRIGKMYFNNISYPPFDVVFENLKKFCRIDLVEKKQAIEHYTEMYTNAIAELLPLTTIVVDIKSFEGDRDEYLAVDGFREGISQDGIWPVYHFLVDLTKKSGEDLRRKIKLRLEVIKFMNAPPESFEDGTKNSQAGMQFSEDGEKSVLTISGSYSMGKNGTFNQQEMEKFFIESFNDFNVEEIFQEIQREKEESLIDEDESHIRQVMLRDYDQMVIKANRDDFLTKKLLAGGYLQISVDGAKQKKKIVTLAAKKDRLYVRDSLKSKSWDEILLSQVTKIQHIQLQKKDGYFEITTSGEAEKKYACTPIENGDVCRDWVEGLEMYVKHSQDAIVDTKKKLGDEISKYETGLLFALTGKNKPDEGEKVPVVITVDWDSLSKSSDRVAAAEAIKTKNVLEDIVSVIEKLSEDKISKDVLLDAIKEIKIVYRTSPEEVDSLDFENKLLTVHYAINRKQRNALEFTTTDDLKSMISLHSRLDAHQVLEAIRSKYLVRYVSRIKAAAGSEIEIEIDGVSFFKETSPQAAVDALNTVCTDNILGKVVEVFEKLCVDQVGKDCVVDSIKKVLVTYDIYCTIQEESGERSLIDVQTKKTIIRDRITLDKILLESFVLNPKAPGGGVDFFPLKDLQAALEEELGLPQKRLIHKLTTVSIPKFVAEIEPLVGEVEVEIDWRSFLLLEEPVRALQLVNGKHVLPKYHAILERACKDEIVLNALTGSLRKIKIRRGGAETDVEKTDVLENGEVWLDYVVLDEVNLETGYSMGIDEWVDLIYSSYQIERLRVITRVKKERVPLFEKEILGLLGAEKKKIPVKIDWKSFREAEEYELQALNTIEDVTFAKLRSILSDICSDEVGRHELGSYLKQIRVQYKRPMVDRDDMDDEEMEKATADRNRVTRLKNGIFTDVFGLKLVEKEGVDKKKKKKGKQKGEEQVMVLRVETDKKEEIRKMFHDQLNLKTKKLLPKVRDKMIPFLEKTVERMLGTQVSIEVDWESLYASNDLHLTLKKLPSNYLIGKHVSLIEEMCKDDVERAQLKEHLSRILFRFASANLPELPEEMEAVEDEVIAALEGESKPIIESEPSSESESETDEDDGSDTARKASGPPVSGQDLMQQIAVESESESSSGSESGSEAEAEDRLEISEGSGLSEKDGDESDDSEDDSDEEGVKSPEVMIPIDSVSLDESDLSKRIAGESSSESESDEGSESGTDGDEDSFSESESETESETETESESSDGESRKKKPKVGAKKGKKIEAKESIVVPESPTRRSPVDSSVASDSVIPQTPLPDIAKMGPPPEVASGLGDIGDGDFLPPPPPPEGDLGEIGDLPPPPEHGDLDDLPPPPAPDFDEKLPLDTMDLPPPPADDKDMLSGLEDIPPPPPEDDADQAERGEGAGDKPFSLERMGDSPTVQVESMSVLDIDETEVEKKLKKLPSSLELERKKKFEHNLLERNETTFSFKSIEEESSSEESLSEYEESSEDENEGTVYSKNRLVKAYWLKKFGTLVDLFDVSTDLYDSVESVGKDQIKEVLVKNCFIREKRIVKEMETRIVQCYSERMSRVLKKKVSVNVNFASFEQGKRALQTLRHISEDISANLLWPILGILASALESDENLRKLTAERLRFFRFTHINHPSATFKCRFRSDPRDKIRKGGFVIKGYFGYDCEIPLKTFDDAFHREFRITNSIITLYRSQLNPDTEKNARSAMLSAWETRKARKEEEERLRKLMLEGCEFMVTVVGGASGVRIKMRCSETFEKLEFVDVSSNKVNNEILMAEIKEIRDGHISGKKKKNDALMFSLTSKTASIVVESDSESTKKDWMKGLDIFVGIRHQQVDKLLTSIKDSDIPEFIAKMNSVTGAKIKFFFDWDSFVKSKDVATTYHYLKGDYVMGRILSVFKELCKDEVAKDVIAKGLRSITFKYRESPEEESSMKLSEEQKNMVDLIDVFELNSKYEDSIYYTGHRKLKSDLELVLLIPQKTKIRQIKNELLHPFEKRMADACGKKLELDIQWKTFSPLSPQMQLLALDVIASKYLLGKTASTIEGLCVDELGVKSVRKSINGIRIEYVSESKQQSGGVKLCEVKDDGYIVDSFFLLLKKREDRFVPVCAKQKEQLALAELYLNLPALRKISSIDQKENAVFADKLREIVGKRLPIEIKWESFMQLSGKLYTSAVHNVVGPHSLGKICEAFEAVCYDDIGKNAVKENIKGIAIRYGDVLDSKEKRARTFVNEAGILHDVFSVHSVSAGGKEDVHASPLALVEEAIESFCHLHEKRSSYGLQSSKLPIYEKKIANVIGSQVKIKMNFDSFGQLNLKEEQLVDAFDAVATDLVLGKLVSVLQAFCGPDKSEMKFNEAFRERLSEKLQLVTIEAKRERKVSRVDKDLLHIAIELDGNKKVKSLDDEALKKVIFQGFALDELKIEVALRKSVIPEFVNKMREAYNTEISLDVDFLSFADCLGSGLAKIEILEQIKTDLVLGKLRKMLVYLSENSVTRNAIAKGINRVEIKYGKIPGDAKYRGTRCAVHEKVLYDCIKGKKGKLSVSTGADVKDLLMKAFNLEEKLLTHEVKKKTLPKFVKEIFELVGGPSPMEVSIDWDSIAEASATDTRVLHAISNYTVMTILKSILAEICSDEIGKTRFRSRIKSIKIRFSHKQRTRIDEKTLVFVYDIESGDDVKKPRVLTMESADIQEYLETACKVKEHRIIKNMKENVIPMYMNYLSKSFMKRIQISVDFDNFVGDYRSITELELNYSANVILPVVYTMMLLSKIPPNGKDVVKRSIQRVNINNLFSTKNVSTDDLARLKSVKLVNSVLELSGAFGIKSPSGERIGHITIPMIEEALMRASEAFKPLVEKKRALVNVKSQELELEDMVKKHKAEQFKELSLKALKTGVRCKWVTDKGDKETEIYIEGTMISLRESLKKKGKDLIAISNIDTIKMGCATDPLLGRDASLCFTIFSRNKYFPFEFNSPEDMKLIHNGLQQTLKLIG